MKECIVCKGKTNAFSAKAYHGKVCLECCAYIPLGTQLQCVGADTLKEIVNRNKEKQERFINTASYGNLFIDSMHGMFCISKKKKRGEPTDFGDVYFIAELQEVAIYCTDVQNIGTNTNRVVCNVKMRVKTADINVEYLICQNEACSYKITKNNMLEWKEPDKLVMFRNMFNQMIDNVRNGLLQKLRDIQVLKAAIIHFDEERAWARSTLFLDDDCSLEAIRKHRDFLLMALNSTNKKEVNENEKAEYVNKINEAYYALTK